MANDSLSLIQAVEATDEIASGGKRLSTIADYWQWAYGNLLDQLDLYAGYLVRLALGCADVGRARDFTWVPEGTDAGISIRVGARCTFKENAQQAASLNVSDFMGRGAKWIALRHRADVLVFAVARASRWKSGPSDLLNAEAWDFYVLPYMGLFDTDWGSSILESDLARYGAKRATFATLPETIKSVRNDGDTLSSSDAQEEKPSHDPVSRDDEQLSSLLGRTMKKIDEALRAPDADPFGPEKIRDLAEKVFQLEPGSLMGKKRSVSIQRYRKAAVYVCRQNYTWPFEKIATAFGRDHSSIMYLTLSVERELREDAPQSTELKKAIDDLNDAVKREIGE